MLKITDNIGEMMQAEDQATVTSNIDLLKRNKRTCKTQMTKMYTRLARFMAADDRESILSGLEEFVEKKCQALEVIEELIVAYKQLGDERNLVKTQDELDSVVNDADRDIMTVKDFLSASLKRLNGTGEIRVQNESELQYSRLIRPQSDLIRRDEDRKSSADSLDEEVSRESLMADKCMLRKTGNEKSDSLVDRKLEPIQIPKFDGDKAKFEYFWAAFSTLIDETDEHPKYKMIRLKACLQGKAADSIARLGFSVEAYSEAKKILKKKYGGHRRQVQNYIEELRNTAPLRERNIDEMERFTDQLVGKIVILKENERWSELQPNSVLYSLVIEKFPGSMLTVFFRWAAENCNAESLESLLNWMLDETEFRVKALESREGLTLDNRKKQQVNERNSRRYFGGVTREGNRWNKERQSCPCCEKTGHRLVDCSKFIREFTVSDRWKLAKEKRLCFRCLGRSHQGKNCSVAKECGTDGCKQTHHKFLHVFSNPSWGRRQDGVKNLPRRSLTDRVLTDSVKDELKAVENQRSYASTLSTVEDSQKVGSFRTVPVWLKANGKKLKVNAVLDDASTASYMNEEVAGALGLSVPYEAVNVQVLNDRVETFDSMPVEVYLESCDGNVNIQFTAFTCSRQITGKYKVIDWSSKQSVWPHLRVCNFPEVPSDPIVDVLIGQDHVDLHYSKCDVKGQPGEPIARLGPLGWSCIGSPSSTQNRSAGDTNLCTFFVRSSVLDQINQSLKQFWEVDSSGTHNNVPVMTDLERSAVEKVRKSLYHDGERYQIAVPWKGEQPELKNNYQMALKRLENTEQRLMRQNDLRECYLNIIRDYQEKGYIHKVSATEEVSPEGKLWYVPHFPIIRLNKTTTKIRIVFDASAKHEGVSLNDEILPGPKLQTELFDVLLRFRRNPVALVSDVKEMYLQIRTPPQDRSFFRFLWRDMETARDPDIYQFERVVFGDASAPFRAQFVARENAERYKEEFPLAAETVKESTYMDDSLDSVTSDEIAIQLYHQLVSLWGKAGMEPRKWLSNSQKVLDVIPVSRQAVEMVELDNRSYPFMKTLGLLWYAPLDVFSFRGIDKELSKLTKRNILSAVASLFDPLGFLTPFVVRAKIFLQELWSKGLSWDDEFDLEATNRIRTWFDELSLIGSIRVSRCLRKASEPRSAMIMTFVDASNDAYGAVSYLRTVYDDESIDVRIIASKSRVAPLVPTSTPRLELLAAILGLRLTISVAAVLHVNLGETRFWSDSLNVLYWIRGKGKQFRPFVANRIGQIQDQTNPEQWQYVNTKENPADLCSRGVSIQQLKKSRLWWEGPTFMRKHEKEWPQQVIGSERKVLPEMKSHLNTFMSLGNKMESVTWKLQPENWSNWVKFINVYAWVIRFVTNTRTTRRQMGPLKAEEIEEVENFVIRKVQQKAFPEEYAAIGKKEPLQNKSRLLNLKPRIDCDGVLRSDGRLTYADFLPFNVRYPIILPRKTWVTKLIVKHYHELGNHVAGVNHILSNLSSKFWIIGDREEIREWESECNECKRKKAKSACQIMAPLPKSRVSPPLQAFHRVAVDFGGPFITTQGRGKRREKRWLCLFTCFLSRAVHLEMAYGLDTDSFLRCLFRMASRRGLPGEILSDLGTNFVGASRELSGLFQQLDKKKIQEKTAVQKIKWRFNPPLAPHFGGLHEIMIKAAKKGINAILGNADINDEELMTAFIHIEDLLNSRPLTYQSSDPKDDLPLTPNHFLIGRCGGESVFDQTLQEGDNLRRRWRRIQELISHFWRRWMKEWIPLLNTRSKWMKEIKDLHVGDIVLAISPDRPRGQWPLGRIVEVYPGKDNHVRVAKVQLGTGTITRPITKLAPIGVKGL